MWLTAREEDEAFWNYRDLALFLGLAPPCLLGGATIVKLKGKSYRVHRGGDESAGN